MPDPNEGISFYEEHGEDDTGRRFANLRAVIHPYEYAIEIQVDMGEGGDRRLAIGRDILAAKARKRRDELRG